METGVADHVWSLAEIVAPAKGKLGLVRSLTVAVALLLLAQPASGAPRSFKCTEPLPEFTLEQASNPSDAALAKLCACIWSKLPEGGWERTVSERERVPGSRSSISTWPRRAAGART